MKHIFLRNPALLFFLVLPALLAVCPSKAYAPRIPGLLERVQQPLYDRNTVATLPATQIDFFQLPVTPVTGDGFAGMGKPDGRGIYVLAEPIDLIPQQDFGCEMDFPVMKLSLEPLYGDAFYPKPVIKAGFDNFGDLIGKKTFGGTSLDIHAFDEGQQETGDRHHKQD